MRDDIGELRKRMLVLRSQIASHETQYRLTEMHERLGETVGPDDGPRRRKGLLRAITGRLARKRSGRQPH